MLKNIIKFRNSDIKKWMYLPFTFLFLIPWAIEKYNDKEVLSRVNFLIYNFFITIIFIFLLFVAIPLLIVII